MSEQNEKGSTLLISVVTLLAVMLLCGQLMHLSMDETKYTNLYTRHQSHYALAVQSAKSFVKLMTPVEIDDDLEGRTESENRLLKHAKSYLQTGRNYFKSDYFAFYNARTQSYIYSLERDVQIESFNVLYLNHPDNNNSYTTPLIGKVTHYQHVKEAVKAIETAPVGKPCLDNFSLLQQELSKPYQFLISTKVQAYQSGRIEPIAKQRVWTFVALSPDDVGRQQVTIEKMYTQRVP